VSGTPIEVLRNEVGEILQTEGEQSVKLPALFQSILKRDPDDFFALGALAVHRARNGKNKAALRLFHQLRAAPKVPPPVREMAEQLGALLQKIISVPRTATDWRSVIGDLRLLAASIFLMNPEDRSAFHSSVEQLCMDLAVRYDQESQARSGHLRHHASPHYVPGLLAQPYWSAEQFELAGKLEDGAAQISQEVGALERDSTRWKKVGKHTHRKDRRLVQSGSWVDIDIFRRGRFNEPNCLKLPITCNLLKGELGLTTNPPGVALISQLRPGTEIGEHTGLTNAELTLHLGIHIPPNSSAGIEVAGQKRSWVQGKVLVFDDSFNHSVWHRGGSSVDQRTVLLVRVWHPEVTVSERQVGLNLALEHPDEAWRESDVERAIYRLQSSDASQLWQEQRERMLTAAAATPRIRLGNASPDSTHDEL